MLSDSLEASVGAVRAHLAPRRPAALMLGRRPWLRRMILQDATGGGLGAAASEPHTDGGWQWSCERGAGGWYKNCSCFQLLWLREPGTSVSCRAVAGLRRQVRIWYLMTRKSLWHSSSQAGPGNMNNKPQPQHRRSHGQSRRMTARHVPPLVRALPLP